MVQNKILFLFANPQGTQQLDQDKEYTAVRDGVLSARFRNDFELDQLRQVSLSRLRSELSEFQPQIVHFSGHGTEDGILLFQDKTDGAAEWAPTEAIADLFRIHNADKSRTSDKKIRLVILSACYSDALAQKLKQFVDFVIGMKNAVLDTVAIDFAKEFYSQLAYGSSVQTAFESGKNAIAVAKISGQEIPELQTTKDASSISFAGDGSDGSSNGGSEQTPFLDSLRQQLAIHQRNLQDYNIELASYGGRDVPVKLLRDIDYTKEQ
ncbi:MAG: CHAT domain-containing protein, partial [Nitrososphaera sp.]